MDLEEQPTEPDTEPVIAAADDEPDPEPQPAVNGNGRSEHVPGGIGLSGERRPVPPSLFRQPVEPNPVAEPSASPAPVLTGERAFRIVELSVALDGSVSCRLRRELVTKVYTAGVAEKLTRFEAMKLPKDEAVFLLLRPSGTAIGAYATGTGRKAPRTVLLKARRMLKQAMPQLFRKARRSSRKPSATRRSSRKGPPNRRRTSRKPAKPVRRRGRR